MIATISNNMDRATAAQIVDRYLAVLKETSTMVSGAPASKLPCEMPLLKQAIEMVLSVTSKAVEEYMVLQEAFCKLALFLPDDEAQMVAMAESAISTMDPTNEGFKYLGKLASAQERIQTAFQELTSELYSWGKTQLDIAD